MSFAYNPRHIHAFNRLVLGKRVQDPDGYRRKRRIEQCPLEQYRLVLVTCFNKVCNRMYNIVSEIKINDKIREY